MPDGKTVVPGYVRIDDISGGQNNWSRSPETLKTQGYRLPDYSKLPPGKYTAAQAEKLLGADSKPEVVTKPGAPPPPVAPPAAKPQIATKPSGPGQLLDVAPARTPVSLQRARIVRLLERLEDVNPKTGETTPKEGREAGVAGLRKRLAEIEAQLVGVKSGQPPTPPVAPEAPATPATPTAAAPPAPAPIPTKPGLGVPQTTSPALAQLRERYGLWSGALAKMNERLFGLKLRLDKLPASATSTPQERDLRDDILQLERNIDRMGIAIGRQGGEIGLARMRAEAEAVKGQPQPSGTQNITPKILKAQKENLLSQLDQAIADAPEPGETKITISVPGDGEFTILNGKDTLKQFRALVEKEFPATVGGSKEPKLPSKKGQSIPPVSDPKPADVPELAADFISKDKDRFVITRAYADGTQIVATDGRQLLRIVTDQAPGRPDAPVRLTEEGAVDPKAEGKFPNWKSVRDPHPVLLYGGADTGQLLHIIRQAQVLAKTTDKKKTFPLQLFVNPDRSLGGRMQAGGDSFEHNVQPGALRLGNYNPGYLANAVIVARRLGNQRVDLYAHGETTGPLGFAGKNHESLVMPLRMDETSTIRDDAKTFAPLARQAEHPELPEGYGPLENPLDLRSRNEGVGDLGNFGTAIEGDSISFTENKTHSGANYQPAKTESIPVGSLKLSELPEAAPARRAAVENVLKDYKPLADKGQGYKKVATTLLKHIDELLAERRQLEQEGQKRREGGQGEVIHGFGGTTVKRPSPEDPNPPVPVPTTPDQQHSLIRSMMPGWAVGITEGFQSLLLPSMKGPKYLQSAEIVGSHIGRMNRLQETSQSKLHPFDLKFSRLGLEREGLDPINNPGTRFRSDMSQGRPMTGWMADCARVIIAEFQKRLDALEAAGASLQTIREHYFPGIWTRASRLAFNAAMEQAVKEGVIPAEGFDVNGATSEQKAYVKGLVDKFLENGTESDKDMLAFLTRRPLGGRESFRKPKVFEDIMDAEQFGLRPDSYNPIDLVKLKLAEMDKAVMAYEHFADLKERGMLRTISPYEDVPEGWTKINDKHGTIYGPPTIGEKEYVDEHIYHGLLAVANSLGVRHERRMSAGRGRLGYASTSGEMVTQFATETSVLAHELGHELDFKYGLWGRIVSSAEGVGKSGKVTKAASQVQRGIIQKELRALANLSWEGQEPSEGYKEKVRKKAEKMAHLLEAYIHAPDKFKTAAPTVFGAFDQFIHSDPKLEPLAKIKPGLALTELQNERYVGLRILGYRIVPTEAGDILNNYLSASIYNNRYFGTLYQGWMGTASALNQSQLGLGSPFHAGFTTIEAQTSANAQVLQDLYGVLRGNRTFGDLGHSLRSAALSTGQTPIIGNRVLNAWREKIGAVDPRIQQVLRAAELGGGGFRMEKGLFTEQSLQTMRAFYSGRLGEAALRSPVALTELMAKPIMEWLVPRQKAGVFAELAWRIIDMNPGKALEELTPQFRQAWNRVDARLGQVRYNRLFMNNTAKGLMQASVRAPGWSGGTIAELGGAFPDAAKFLREWVATGKAPQNLPDRTAYLLSTLGTTAVMCGALTYAFTGTLPRSAMDLFSVRTGKKDEQGNEERFLLPSYVKDILAYLKHPGTTLVNKSHPLIAVIGDIARNKDYYGVEVHSPLAGAGTQVAQSAGYVLKAFVPFWMRGVARERARGAGFARQALPLVGIMPAPRSVTQSAAENLAHELMLQQIPAGPRTAESAARAQAAAALDKTPYLERTVKRLNPEAAVRVYQAASPKNAAASAPPYSPKS